MYSKLRDNMEERIKYWGQETYDLDIMDFSEYDLIDAIEKSNSFRLYRYSPSSYYTIRNIETQKIHLSENGVMNDIYCIKVWK